MSWGNLESTINANRGNGGKWLKVKDGDRHEVLFLSAPYMQTKTWSEGRSSDRYGFVVYCTSDPAAAQLFECGPGVAKDLAKEMKGVNPAEVKVMIKREGSGQTDTRYTVARLGKADAAELKAAKAADADRSWDMAEEGWTPLSELAKTDPYAAAPKATPASNEAPDDDIPF
jgi:hypothetical protein